jgi:hypothetical protein
MGQLAQGVDWSAESGIALRAPSEPHFFARELSPALIELRPLPLLPETPESVDDSFDPPTARFVREGRNDFAEPSESLESWELKSFDPFDDDEPEEAPATLRSPGWTPIPPSQTRPGPQATRGQAAAVASAYDVSSSFDPSSEIRAERAPRVSTTRPVAIRDESSSRCEPLPASLLSMIDAW